MYLYCEDVGRNVNTLALSCLERDCTWIHEKIKLYSFEISPAYCTMCPS